MTNQTAHASLPAEFADLERFIERWDLPSTNARYARRLSSPIEELKEFFEMMMSRVDRIKTFLDAKPFNEYTDQDRRLGRLMFALGVVGPAVEIFKQPPVTDSSAITFDVTHEWRILSDEHSKTARR